MFFEQDLKTDLSENNESNRKKIEKWHVWNLTVLNTNSEEKNNNNAVNKNKNKLLRPQHINLNLLVFAPWAVNIDQFWHCLRSGMEVPNLNLNFELARHRVRQDILQFCCGYFGVTNNGYKGEKLWQVWTHKKSLRQQISPKTCVSYVQSP